jgi:hypothetical protein
MSFHAYLRLFRKELTKGVIEPTIEESTHFPIVQYETVHSRSCFETVEGASAEDDSLKQNLCLVIALTFVLR